MKNDFMFNALMGVIYFGVVYSLVKLVQPHGGWAVVGVIYACTFSLYYFVYKIRDLKQYLQSGAILGSILGAFFVAGKMGMLAATAIYILVIAWALFARRNRIKEAYKIFETEADKVFYKVDVKEEKPKTVKAKKPSSTSKKNKTEHKHKQKARKKDSHKASKSSTVKKNSKKRTKKATAN